MSAPKFLELLDAANLAQHAGEPQVAAALIAQIRRRFDAAPLGTVFVAHDDGSTECERCARARGLDLASDDVSTWEVGSSGWTAGDFVCRVCGVPIPVVVDGGVS